MKKLLPDINETKRLGARLGRALAASAAARGPLPVFFYGDLGAGKTTLISALVTSLPGGESAETASPSFTLCNMYATTPPVAHFDLYRQENGSADESLLDFLDEGRHLVLIEWAERLPASALPPERIACALNAAAPDAENARTITLVPHGDAAVRLLALFEA
jgi:tRNA threonylcarbamoyladenosine biosynthesis protein TsaE